MQSLVSRHQSKPWSFLLLLLCIRTNPSSSFSKSYTSNAFPKNRMIPRESQLYVSTDSIAVDLQYKEFTIVEPIDATSEDMDSDIHDPVIFLHGLLGSKRNFSYIGTSLSRQLKKKRRVLAVDLRNHGDNDHDWRENMSYADMAQDVLQFMDKMDFSRVVLVGHSMGGKVAKACALLHPDRVSGLVVLDIAPVAYDYRKDASWNGVHNLIKMLNGVVLEEDMTKKDIDMKLRKLIDDPALRAFVLTNLSTQKQQLKWKINIPAIFNQLSILADFQLVSSSTTSSLQYHGDAFFIHGGSSRFIRSVHMESIRGYFPNHMLTTIRGAGHWVHADAPDDTLALLKKYLDR